MFQRIQTLWMLLSLIAMVTFSFINIFSFPIFGKEISASVYDLTFGGLHNFVNYFDFWGSWILGILTYMYMVLVAVSLFLFKKRILQARILTFSTILLVFLIGIVIYVYFKLKYASYGFGNIFSFLPVVFNILAIRGIYFDEALVRSMNRLR